MVGKYEPLNGSGKGSRARDGEKIWDGSDLVRGKNPDGTIVEIYTGEDLINLPREKLRHLPPDIQNIVAWEKYRRKNGIPPSSSYPLHPPPDEEMITYDPFTGKPISGDQADNGHPPSDNPKDNGARPSDNADNSEGGDTASASKTRAYTRLNPVELALLKKLKEAIAAGDIKPGVYNGDVAEAQAILEKHGYKLPKYGADGKFGDETSGMILAAEINSRPARIHAPAV